MMSLAKTLKRERDLKENFTKKKKIHARCTLYQKALLAAVARKWLSFFLFLSNERRVPKKKKKKKK